MPWKRPNDTMALNVDPPGISPYWLPVLEYDVEYVVSPIPITFRMIIC